MKKKHIFYNLSRAFDTIDNNLLLMKLEAMEIPGGFLVWVKLCILNRQQTVMMNSVKSKTLIYFSKGVPQDFILWSIYLIIFLSSLLNNMYSSGTKSSCMQITQIF